MVEVKRHDRVYKSSGKITSVDPHFRRPQRTNRGFKSVGKYIPVDTPEGKVFMTRREIKIAKQRTKKMKK